jgi:hypothetical protein
MTAPKRIFKNTQNTALIKEKRHKERKDIL